MIEKLSFLDTSVNCVDYNGFVHNVAEGGIINKINELIDAVNELQKDYDNVCIWVGEQKLKTPAKNVPGPIKLYVCADGSVYDSLDVAKSHAASIFNPLPAGATTTDRVYLEQELNRTRKALEIAVDALKVYANPENWDFEHFYSLDTYDIAGNALKQITALEQKDK